MALSKVVSCSGKKKTPSYQTWVFFYKCAHVQGESQLVNFLLVSVCPVPESQRVPCTRLSELSFFFLFFLTFSFIMKQFLHIYWPLVPSHARQRDKKNNDEALTSRPKWVVCLWLWVAIPGMSWLHPSVTHCFQDNHSEEGVGSSCSSHVIYRKRSPWCPVPV